MNKLNLHTSDLVQKNIYAIAQLFPSVITEAQDADGVLQKAIDFEKLKLLLSAGATLLEDDRERYEFTWVGKRQAMIDAATPINKTLRPCPQESKNWESTENLYIEGDNLEVLKLLQESYLGKVKMIYIDPPYNTGKDFIYRDNFTQGREEYEEELGMYDEEENRLFQNTATNGRFHSDWCSMIYPRLQLARNLLTEDGVIFISIDDNEVENLKKIGNEIFGEDNFVGQWNWFKSATPPNLSHKIKKNIEYVIVYEKKRSGIIYSGIKKISPSDDPMTKPQNSIKVLKFPPSSINFKIENQLIQCGIYGTDKYPNELLNDLIVENGVNKNEVSFSNRFIWLQEKLEEELLIGTTINCSKSLVISYKKSNYAPEVPPNLIDISVGVDTTEEAGKQLGLLIGEKVFDYPKPVSLIKYLIDFKENDLVLDFFSGSATTAHAVMQLNAEDGGNRKFIMVQLPEVCEKGSEAAKAGYKNICEIGKERIRRAGVKIEQELKAIDNNMFNEREQSLDTGFRVFKLNSTNMKDVYYAAGELTQQLLFDSISNIKDDRSGIDLLYGCLLDWGVPLSLPHTTEVIEGATVHFVNQTDMAACFDEQISEVAVRAIAARKPVRAVFRDASFKDSADKLNVGEIFKAVSPDTTIKVI